MTVDQLEAWCRRNGMPHTARAYLERVLSSPPSRRPQSRKVSNVTGFYPSRKMGLTINFESHKNELAAIYLHENDADVIAYYDQPEAIKLSYPSLTGRNIAVIHTPDFLVVRSTGGTLQEWKPEETLVDLARTMPHRYIRRNDGTWYCPPGEKAASELGLNYEVHSSAELNRCFLRNTVFLEDYFRGEPQPTPEDITDRIVEIVRNKPAITLLELTREAVGISVDQINTMIAREEIYVDLSAKPLVDKDLVRVFVTRATATAYVEVNEEPPVQEHTSAHPVRLIPGQSVAWDGRTLSTKFIGESSVGFIDEQGNYVEMPRSVIERMFASGKFSSLDLSLQEHEDAKKKAVRVIVEADDDDLAKANERWSLIKPQIQTPTSRCLAMITASPSKARSCRRWISDYHRARRLHGIGYVGLIPKPNPGNRMEKLSPAASEAIQYIIETEYENLRNKTIASVYGALRNYCEKNGIVCPSRKTLTRRIKLRPQHAQALARRGKRAAYTEEFFWDLDAHTPRHGDRAFEIGHIDHTQLDQELVCEQTKRNLGRPWITILMDAFSRRVLSVYMTYDPPSYRSCMMVLRICVMRHHRLPQIIVVDGGKEFSSTYFDTLLARYECTKKVRPPRRPRYGSVCERFFQTDNTQFVHNLLGNTKLMKDPRTVSKEVNPKHNTVWTMHRLYERMCTFAYEVYDTNDHPALHQTPREAFAASLDRDGEREHLYIPYDDTFRLMTLPSTRTGRATVVPRRGVRINYIYYTCNEFRDPRFVGKSVPVRYDPFDSGTAYAFVNDRWTLCVSEYRHLLLGRTEREIMLITAEIRKKNQLHTSKSIDITASKIATFLSECRTHEDISLQQAKDAEAKKLFEQLDIDGASAIALPKNTAPPHALALEDSSIPPTEPQLQPSELEDLEGYQQ